MRSLQEVGYRCPAWEKARSQGTDMKPCVTPFDRYLDVVDFGEYEHYGTRLRVPRIYLHGTQALNEYDNSKRKTVEERLRKCGTGCLDQHPARVLALPEGNQMYLPIFDGHHRIRYSGGFSINIIPSVIYTLEELTQVANETYAYGHPVDEAFLRSKFTREMMEAKESFSRSMPAIKQPIPLKASSAEELKAIFPSF